MAATGQGHMRRNLPTKTTDRPSGSTSWRNEASERLQRGRDLARSSLNLTSYHRLHSPHPVQQHEDHFPHHHHHHDDASFLHLRRGPRLRGRLLRVVLPRTPLRMASSPIVDETSTNRELTFDLARSLQTPSPCLASPTAARFGSARPTAARSRVATIAGRSKTRPNSTARRAE